MGLKGMAMFVVVRFNFEILHEGNGKFSKWEVDKDQGVVVVHRVYFCIHGLFPIGI